MGNVPNPYPGTCFATHGQQTPDRQGGSCLSSLCPPLDRTLSKRARVCRCPCLARKQPKEINNGQKADEQPLPVCGCVDTCVHRCTGTCTSPWASVWWRLLVFALLSNSHRPTPSCTCDPAKRGRTFVGGSDTSAHQPNTHTYCVGSTAPLRLIVDRAVSWSACLTAARGKDETPREWPWP